LKRHVIVHRYVQLNIFVAVLTDGLAKAENIMEDFEDEDEEPSVTEPNFVAPGDLLPALARSLPAARPRNTLEACRSRVHDSGL
jgi:hypothetical protein